MPFFDTIVYPERKGHRFLEKKNHEKEIQMSCGHLETVDLPRDNAAAEKRIKYLRAEGLCKDCYRKARRTEAEKTPLTLVIQMQPANPYKNLRLRFTGNTLPQKDVIKDLGFQWGKFDREIGVFCVSHRNKTELGWYKYVSEADLAEELEKIRAAFPGIPITDQTDDFDRAAYALRKESYEQTDSF